jgi:hypothetical protein
MNYLANALPINGLNTGEVSALFPNYFVPAGYTFSIWGVIYLLLLVFIVYQSRGWVGDYTDANWIYTIGNLFFYTCLFNATWIIAWHFLQPLLAFGLMLLLLYTLIRIYIRLESADSTSPAPKLVKIAFSTYLAWISVATIANATAVLVYYNWIPPVLSPAQWAGTMILVAALLGIYFIWKKGDYIFGLVIIWALAGIYSARLYSEELYIFIKVAIIAGIAGLLIAMVASLIRKKTD